MKKSAFFKIQGHHIIPKSRNGQRTEENMKFIRNDYHRAYHKLFENLTPEEIHEYLDEVWFSPTMFISPALWLQLKKHPL